MIIRTYYSRIGGMDRTKLLSISKIGGKYRVLYEMVNCYRAFILPVSELSKYEILWIIHHLTIKEGNNDIF